VHSPLRTCIALASFRGYADYMQTPGFEESLPDLIELAKQAAIMCAEAVPWRCHRSLIVDALSARGITVREITGVDRTKLHTLTPWARLIGTHVTYPGEPTRANIDVLFTEAIQRNGASPRLPSFV
jgi:uncharacterized protein (DUF488 family)